MFSLKEFIKKGLLDAVGKMADFQVILNAAGWLEKGVLDETDLAEINAKIDAQYIVPEIPEAPEEIPEEESAELPEELSEEIPVELPEEEE